MAEDVLRVATRVTPSCPGYVSIITIVIMTTGQRVRFILQDDDVAIVDLAALRVCTVLLQEVVPPSLPDVL